MEYHDVPITIACGNYDRTKAIIDGRVKVEGCAVTYLPLYPEKFSIASSCSRNSTSLKCRCRATSGPSLPGTSD